MSTEVKVNVTVGGAKQAASDIGQVGQAASDTQAGVNGMVSSLDKMTGGMVTAFKGVATGLKNGVKGLKTFKMALISTGIGALVVAVGSLVTAFRSSEEGAQKLRRIMGVLGSVTDNLLDVVADLGEGIISVFENPQQALKDFSNLLKDNIVNRFEGLFELVPKLSEAIGLLFEGKFGQAAKTAADAVGKVTLGVESITDSAAAAGEAVSNFGKQLVEEGKQADIIAQKRNRATKLERELLVQRSKLESEIAALRLKSRQEQEFSAEERKQALLDAQALEDQLLEKETEVLVLRRDAQIEENKLARSSEENLDKEAQAIAAVNRQQAARLNQQRATQRELNRVDKEIERNNKAKDKEAEAARKKQEAEDQKLLAARQKLADDLYKASLEGFDKEEQALMEKYEAQIAIAGDDEGLLLAAEERYLADRAKLVEKYAAQDEKVQADSDARATASRVKNMQMVVQTAQALTGLLQEVFKADADATEEQQRKAFEKGKKLQIAGVVMSTASAIMAALAAPPVGYGSSPAGIAASITAGLLGATQIAAISKQQFGATASTDTGGSPTTSFTRALTPDNFAASATSPTGNNMVQPDPLRAYVVSTEMTSQQQLDAQLSHRSRL